MNTKHTPAPWKVAESLNEDGFRALAVWPEEELKKAHGRIICKVSPMEALDDSDIANANLIAAAPELLAVMKQAVEDIRGEWNTDFLVAKMDAVIAKAEGVATGNTAQS